MSGWLVSPTTLQQVSSRKHSKLIQSDLAFADGSEALKTLLPKQYEDRRGCPYLSLLEEVQGKFAHSAAYENTFFPTPKATSKSGCQCQQCQLYAHSLLWFGGLKSHTIATHGWSDLLSVNCIEMTNLRKGSQESQLLQEMKHNTWWKNGQDTWKKHTKWEVKIRK